MQASVHNSVFPRWRVRIGVSHEEGKLAPIGVHTRQALNAKLGMPKYHSSATWSKNSEIPKPLGFSRDHQCEFS